MRLRGTRPLDREEIDGIGYAMGGALENTGNAAAFTANLHAIIITLAAVDAHSQIQDLLDSVADGYAAESSGGAAAERLLTAIFGEHEQATA